MKSLKEFKKEVREAVANYMQSEGCSCCRDIGHSKNAEVIAKMLSVPRYKDGSGYDFRKFRTTEKKLNKTKSIAGQS